MKIIAFWDITLCSLTGVDDVSEVCNASIVWEMKEAVRTSETSF
jgi:hypothetical protein